MSTISPQTGTAANVAGAASSTVLFTAVGNAKGRTIWNDSTAILYVKFGTGASATSCTVKLVADAYYEFPAPCYSGVVEGLWASATGSARVTSW
jgi:hypothetical protein